MVRPDAPYGGEAAAHDVCLLLCPGMSESGIATAAKWLGLIQVALFGLLWMGIGLGLFGWITAKQWQKEADHAAIAAGGVTAQRLAVDEVRPNEGQPPSWDVVAIAPDGGRIRTLATREAGVAKRIEAEGAVTAWEVEGRWRVPELGDPGPEARWVFLAFGLLPLLVGAIGWAAWRWVGTRNVEAKARVDAATARVRTAGEIR